MRLVRSGSLPLTEDGQALGAALGTLGVGQAPLGVPLVTGAPAEGDECCCEFFLAGDRYTGRGSDLPCCRGRLWCHLCLLLLRLRLPFPAHHAEGLALHLEEGGPAGSTCPG